MIKKMFKSIIDQDRAAIVVCDVEHTIRYMNPTAISRYAKRGGASLIGKSLLECHNENSVKMIKKVLAWFQESPDNNMIYTYRNEKENKDVYMVALRDEDESLIGYYEKHEYRDNEKAPCYDFSKSLVPSRKKAGGNLGWIFNCLYQASYLADNYTKRIYYDENDNEYERDLLEGVNSYIIKVRGKIKNSILTRMVSKEDLFADNMPAYSSNDEMSNRIIMMISSQFMFGNQAFALELEEISSAEISFESDSKYNTDIQKENLKTMLSNYIFACSHTGKYDDDGFEIYDYGKLGFYAYKRFSQEDLLYGANSFITVKDEVKDITYDSSNPLTKDILPGTDVEVVVKWEDFTDESYNKWNIETVRILNEDSNVSSSDALYFNTVNDLNYDPYNIKSFYDMSNADECNTYEIIKEMLCNIKSAELFYNIDKNQAGMWSLYGDKFSVIEKVTKTVVGKCISNCENCRNNKLCGHEQDKCKFYLKNNEIVNDNFKHIKKILKGFEQNGGKYKFASSQYKKLNNIRKVRNEIQHINNDVLDRDMAAEIEKINELTESYINTLKVINEQIKYVNEMGKCMGVFLDTPNSTLNKKKRKKQLSCENDK